MISLTNDAVKLHHLLNLISQKHHLDSFAFTFDISGTIKSLFTDYKNIPKSALDKIKRKMKLIIDNLMAAKTSKTNLKHLISRISNTAIKYCLLFKEKVSYKLIQNLWSKKSLGIILVFIFTICNSIITAHYLSSFSFELENDMFSYIGFIILSICVITIINAKWIKIVIEKYVDSF